MKKRYFIFIFFVICGISIFSDNDRQEEVDFLLFSPNSSDQFVNDEQASIQLDNLARYLSNKNLTPGQIIVYGYAAFAQNDIESVALSRDRALFVIDELQKRGVSKDLFSDPVGYGSVYLWGNNDNENDRKLNRRVRILLDGESPTPVTHEVINAETETEKTDIVHEEPAVTEATPEDTSKESDSKFPWWVLLLLALLIALLLKKRSRKPTPKNETTIVQPRIPEADPVPAPVPVPVPAAATAVNTVNLDEEIRLRAYELSQRRNEQGDYRDQDWYNAVREISAWYTACGYSVFFEDGHWWASQSYSY